MKEKKNKIDAIFSAAEKNARELWENAVQVADQNDDGKFDMSDVSVIAETIGNTMKKGARVVKERVEEKSKEIELNSLQPIFVDTLTENEFLIPKFVRVVDRDKKRAESEVCQGSIGYTSEQKGVHLVNIFRDSIDSFGLTFYPDIDSEFYYVDPSDRDRYVALDEYFGYLKIARINELQRIAQDLGAKYFKVTYKEEKTLFSEKKTDVHGKAINVVDVKHNSMEKQYTTVEIAAENEFPGHAPTKPELKYMKRDPSIQTLITMRLDEKAPLLNQRFMLKMSNSSGMKESDAIKIDAVLKGFKCSGNTTVASEARNESRRYLEYDISFD